jgi:hypothetical protein
MIVEITGKIKSVNNLYIKNKFDREWQYFCYNKIESWKNIFKGKLCYEEKHQFSVVESLDDFEFNVDNKENGKLIYINILLLEVLIENKTEKLENILDFIVKLF